MLINQKGLGKKVVSLYIALKIAKKCLILCDETNVIEEFLFFLLKIQWFWKINTFKVLTMKEVIRRWFPDKLEQLNVFESENCLFEPEKDIFIVPL